MRLNISPQSGPSKQWTDLEFPLTDIYSSREPEIDTTPPSGKEHWSITQGQPQRQIRDRDFRQHHVQGILKSYILSLQEIFGRLSFEEVLEKLPIIYPDSQNSPTSFPRIMSPMGLYNRVSTGNPFYAPYRAEAAIFEQFGDKICQFLDERTLFELGSGTAYKTVQLVNQLYARGGSLRRYIANDFTAANAKIAAANVAKAMSPQAPAAQMNESGQLHLNDDSIISVPGDIIESQYLHQDELHKLWEQNAISATRPLSFDNRFIDWMHQQKVVTISLGSWLFNNTTLEQQKDILRFLASFNEDAIHLIAIDFTQDKGALGRSYGDYMFQQLFYTAAMIKMHEQGVSFDPADLACRMNFIETKMETLVRPEIYSRQNPNKFAAFEDIKKINWPFFVGMAKVYGLEFITPHMEYANDNNNCKLVALRPSHNTPFYFTGLDTVAA